MKLILLKRYIHYKAIKSVSNDKLLKNKNTIGFVEHRGLLVYMINKQSLN